MTEAARVWTDSVQRHWPNAPERIEDFKHRFPDRWVRFHSLPDSRRYPETEDEYAIVFGRHPTVLDELAAGLPGSATICATATERGCRTFPVGSDPEGGDVAEPRPARQIG